MSTVDSYAYGPVSILYLNIFPKSHFLPRHFSQIGEVFNYFLVTYLLFI